MAEIWFVSISNQVTLKAITQKLPEKDLNTRQNFGDGNFEITRSFLKQFLRNCLKKLFDC